MDVRTRTRRVRLSTNRIQHVFVSYERGHYENSIMSTIDDVISSQFRFIEKKKKKRQIYTQNKTKKNHCIAGVGNFASNCTPDPE